MSIDPVFIQNKKVVSAVSMAADINSDISDISEIRYISVHAIYTGSPTGSLGIYGSNDGVDFRLLETATAISAAGGVIRNFSGLGCKFIQVKYTYSSGTGSLTVYVSGKC